MEKTQVTQSLLKDLFSYKEGFLYWKNNSNPAKNGTRFGTLDKSVGYYTGKAVSLGGKWKVHRLIYLYHHGQLPKYIDHINGVRHDNRIENLRAATMQQNNFNTTAKSNTGVKNVVYLASRNLWEVQFTRNRKTIFFKRCASLEEAKLLADTMRAQLHGEFYRE